MDYSIYKIRPEATAETLEYHAYDVTSVRLINQSAAVTCYFNVEGSDAVGSDVGGDNKKLAAGIGTEITIAISDPSHGISMIRDTGAGSDGYVEIWERGSARTTNRADAARMSLFGATEADEIPTASHVPGSLTAGPYDGSFTILSPNLHWLNNGQLASEGLNRRLLSGRYTYDVVSGMRLEASTQMELWGLNAPLLNLSFDDFGYGAFRMTDCVLWDPVAGINVKTGTAGTTQYRYLGRVRFNGESGPSLIEAQKSSGASDPTLQELYIYDLRAPYLTCNYQNSDCYGIRGHFRGVAGTIFHVERAWIRSPQLPAHQRMWNPAIPGNFPECFNAIETNLSSGSQLPRALYLKDILIDGCLGAAIRAGAYSTITLSNVWIYDACQSEGSPIELFRPSGISPTVTFSNVYVDGVLQSAPVPTEI